LLVLRTHAQDFAADCSAPGEPTAAAAAFCAKHGWPEVACGEARSRAEESCHLLLAAAGSQQDQQPPPTWFRTTFNLDATRRFQVAVGPDQRQTYMVEVGPWDDVAAVAAADGRSMGLDAAAVTQLTDWLETQLEGDAAFQAMRQQQHAQRTAATEEAP
jgi:hypothetical protein